MSLSQELSSWMFPTNHSLSKPPRPGDIAPSTEQLKLPCEDGKPAVVVFLRHCGCPFAEKTFRALRTAASSHSDIHIIAISHSTQSHTEKWLSELGGAESISVVVDPERTLYARWGLGASSFWHLLSPWTWYDLFALARKEGIVNRPTESGSRWQQSGAWAIDGKGKVIRGGPAGQASEIPETEALVASVTQ